MPPEWIYFSLVPSPHFLFYSFLFENYLFYSILSLFLMHALWCYTAVLPDLTPFSNKRMSSTSTDLRHVLLFWVLDYKVLKREFT